MERIEEGWLWLPRIAPINWKLLIDGVDQTIYATFEWSESICPEIGTFKISLINIEGIFNDKYLGGESVQIYVDYNDATTKRFEGIIEKPSKKFSGNNYTLEIKGTHVSSETLDVTVTESYSDVAIHLVLIDIIGKYLTNFTYTNVNEIKDEEGNTITFTGNWSNKPFWDCVADLVKVGEADCYIDDDKDFHLFKQGSIYNYDEAITWNDNILDISELGIDTIDVKNKTIVYGKDNTGLPVIYTDSNSSSQTTYKLKEQIIRDTNIQNFTQALDLATANTQATPDDTGKASSIIMPAIHPGDKIPISDPAHNVHAWYRIVKFTHKIPELTTEVIISEEKTIPKLFKSRISKEFALEDITNPYKMEFSSNFVFDDPSDTASKDSNLDITDSELRMTSGNSGTWESTITTNSAISNVSEFHLKVKGESLANAEFWASNDNKVSWKSITPDQRIYTDSTGNQVSLKIRLTSTSTTIDGCALLYKG